MPSTDCDRPSDSGEDGLVGTEIGLPSFLRDLPIGVLLEDTDREIVAVNPTLCDVLDAPVEPSDLIGRDCTRTAEELKDRFADPDQFVARIEAILERREPVYDERLRLADGRTLERTYVPCTVSELPDGRGNLWLYRDVTDRDGREQSLEDSTEQVESFTAVVSHDLRNPLNVASANLESVAEEYDSDRLDAAAAALDRMESLIDDLLVLTREGNAIGDREPLNLDEVIRTAWTYVETEDAVLEIDSDVDRTISADRSRLTQVFENLFRNAVEHGSTSSPSQAQENAVEHGSTTPASQTQEDAIEHGGRDVRITVGTVPDGIYVADDGPGIPAERRDRIFESGYSTAEQGSGLGLRITETIVEAHGWEIEVGDAHCGGTRFEITGIRFLD